MTRSLRAWPALAGLTLLSLTACGVPAEDAPVVAGPSSPADAGVTLDWLVETAPTPPTSMVVVPHDPAAVGTPQPNDPRVRVGVSERVDLPLDLSGVDAASLAQGATIEAAGGVVKAEGDGFVFAAHIRAPGATAVRLHLEDLYLPRHAELWIYDGLTDAHGPFLGRGTAGNGEIWTPTLLGEDVWVQVRYDGTDTDRVLDAVGATIAEVGTIGSGFGLGLSAAEQAAACGFNASCVEDAATSLVPAAIQPARDAVALMLYQSGRYYYICSGGLLADTAASGTPYFLTANHCISKGREANSLETFFQYATDDGDNCTFPDATHVPRTVGADILSTNRTSDYTLLQLSGHPGGTTIELPWSTVDVAFADGTPLYRVSHPQGAPQSYSEHLVEASYGTCSSWPRGPWIYSADIWGATEGGSSGSPVLNAAGEVVGQLSGGCGTNVNDVCDSVSNATVDGNLASYFGEVSSWLDPTEPPSCDPVPEDCSNGIDDDCDGAIDADDSDCGTTEPPGTCDLGLSGDSCVADGECCSAKCKGKPGSRTCN